MEAAVKAYYNEIEPYAAQWLRNLISEGLIAQGDVDERSIEDVTSADLTGYTQCHFFAGIGGWSYALRLAGWGDSRPVWTGSCPCQPFSIAGEGKGTSDERHLWPAFLHLIRVCQPSVVFGEQVEAAIRHGWLDLVRDDLEGEGYAFGAFGIPACSVQASHERKRLWWVADSSSKGREGHIDDYCISSVQQETRPVIGYEAYRSGSALVQHISGILPSDGIFGALERARAKCYGNAIVPQVAAEVIKAYMECRP